MQKQIVSLVLAAYLTKKLRPMTLGVESTPRVNFSVWDNFDTFSSVSNILRVREFIPATPKWATLTDDLKMLGHLSLPVTDLSQLLLAIATNLVLFQMLYGSGNSFQ